MLPFSTARPATGTGLSKERVNPYNSTLLISGHCLPLLIFSLYLLLLSNLSRAIVSAFLSLQYSPPVHLVLFRLTTPSEKLPQPWNISTLPRQLEERGPEIINYSTVPQNWQPRLLADALIYKEHPCLGHPCVRLELRWKSKPGLSQFFTGLSGGMPKGPPQGHQVCQLALL